MRSALVAGLFAAIFCCLCGCQSVCSPHAAYLQTGKHAVHGLHSLHGLETHYEPVGDCCEEKWDPILGSCGGCGGCRGTCEGRTPAQHLKYVLTCSGGCGELYWDEWISDPPEPCDPCDDWGNWVGPPGCCPSFWDHLCSGWQSFFGHRNSGPESCLSCGSAGFHASPCDAGLGEVIVEPLPMKGPSMPVLPGNMTRQPARSPYLASPVHIRSTRLAR